MSLFTDSERFTVWSTVMQVCLIPSLSVFHHLKLPFPCLGFIHPSNDSIRPIEDRVLSQPVLSSKSPEML